MKVPYSLKSILIAPGERIDLIVDFALSNSGDEIFLLSKKFNGGGNIQGKQEYKFLKFNITHKVILPYSVPTTLSSISTLTVSQAIRSRYFDISNGGMNMQGGLHRINNKVYDENRIDETVLANTIEIWQFDNSNGQEPHPMHIHGVKFQVLSRSGV